MGHAKRQQHRRNQECARRAAKANRCHILRGFECPCIPGIRVRVGNGGASRVQYGSTQSPVCPRFCAYLDGPQLPPRPPRPWRSRLALAWPPATRSQ